MDIESVDLREGPAVCSVGGHELRDDGEGLRRVHRLGRAVEALVTHAEAVEVAAVFFSKERERSVSQNARGDLMAESLTFVAEPRVSIVAAPAVLALAPRLAGDLARVRSIRSGVQVGLPQIHLAATSSVLGRARIGIAGRASPATNIGLERR